MLSFEFCCWFGGLVDGEGCFVIQKLGTPRLRVALREDDAEALKYAQRTLGLGTLCAGNNQHQRDTGKNVRDTCIFTISGHQECSLVVPVLRGKLHTKKADEFEVWATAVLASAALGSKPHPQRRALMAPYRTELHRLRRR